MGLQFDVKCRNPDCDFFSPEFAAESLAEEDLKSREDSGYVDLVMPHELFI